MWKHHPLNKEVIEVKMTIEKGYWPCCGNLTNVTRMVKCNYQVSAFKGVKKLLDRSPDKSFDAKVR
jgi:hypothetical protein